MYGKWMFSIDGSDAYAANTTALVWQSGNDF